MRICSAILVSALITGRVALAEDFVIADLAQTQDMARWEFFTDGVMGGVSTGQARLADGAVTLQGQVSTDNNGGFLQIRLSDVVLPADATGLTARVRGNGQIYFLHLRSKDTRLPWHYYQAAFSAGSEWSEVTLPLSAFQPSHRVLPREVTAGRVTSVALVAYGRDHDADVSLSRLLAR